MMRLAALAAVGACAAAAGVGAAQAARTRADLLRDLRAALLQMMDGMLLGALPLPALLRRAARGRAGALFDMAGRIMEEAPELGFQAALTRAERELRRGTLRVLRAEDLAALNPWLSMIGEGGMEQQRRALEGAVRVLERLEQEARGRLKDEMRLYRTLGLTGGAALILLLW